MGSSDSKSLSPDQPRQAYALGTNRGSCDPGISPLVSGLTHITMQLHTRVHTFSPPGVTQADTHVHQLTQICTGTGCHTHSCLHTHWASHTLIFMQHKACSSPTQHTYTHVHTYRLWLDTSRCVSSPEVREWHLESPAHWQPAGPFLMQMTPGSLRWDWGPAPSERNGWGQGTAHAHTHLYC